MYTSQPVANSYTFLYSESIPKRKNETQDVEDTGI